MAASSSDCAAQSSTHAVNDLERAGVVTHAVYCRHLTEVPREIVQNGLSFRAVETDPTCHS